jgi:hypothetical protein
MSREGKGRPESEAKSARLESLAYQPFRIGLGLVGEALSLAFSSGDCQYDVNRRRAEGSAAVGGASGG